MTRSLRLTALFMMAAMLSCSSDHLIADKSFRKAVLNDYKVRADKYAAVRGDLFLFVDTVTDNSRREALQFLLAYMPLSDIAVYDPHNLYAAADVALKSRKEMAWGASVPYDIFLHFVLPPRVNNENPDNFRIVMYNELKERVDGLDALSAALEINRWCHEKVTYQPSDIRTSSPLATMLSARGRCGEESTFTVAALRTAGLPARQVYTPRWAHSDDNHAWVEVWVNGKWHYMGACEPEMVPDKGWFTEPARRAMLVHTRAFGRYTGEELLVKRDDLFSELNTLKTYAITKSLKVSVTDSSDMPVPAATVRYLIYNYAEFYPLASLKCDDRGVCSLVTGIGSLLVWADDGLRYGFTYASPSDTSLTVVISLSHPSGILDLDIKAPPVMPPLPSIDDEMIVQNNLLLKKEDSIRNAYVSTWMRDIPVAEIVAATSIPKERIEDLLERSMGNCREISSFIRGADEKTDIALRILDNITDKDLRDTPCAILLDHLANAPENKSRWENAFYDRWVLSPRIDNEILSPFRSSLKKLAPELISRFATEPETIAAWIDSAITVNDTENYYSTPIIPAGVERLRVADRHSRDIFFVALARTVGQPARLEPGTGRPQYYAAGEWITVLFDGDPRPSGNCGYVTFVTDERNPVPEYHIHFTLARLENGRYNTLDYGYNVRIGELPEHIPLDPGSYMLVTGNRDENGNVQSQLTFFELSRDEDIRVDVTLRRRDITVTAGGEIDTGITFTSWNGENIDLGPRISKGAVLVWLEPGKEPTRHILNDLPLLKKEFDVWGGQFIFLIDPVISSQGFSPEEFAGLPENSILAVDSCNTFMLSALGGTSSVHPLPVVICIDDGGKILFTSEGYRIGTGEQILKTFLNQMQ